MKKSLLIVILSLLLVLIGCQKKIDTKRIAVVSNQKENKVLLLDNNNKVLAEKFVDGNYRFLLQNRLLFYSADGKEYKKKGDINILRSTRTDRNETTE